MIFWPGFGHLRINFFYLRSGLLLVKVPVWVKLPCLNIQLWTKKGLSKIASALGTPLSTDGLTDKGGMLNYVRITVYGEEMCPRDKPHNSVIMEANIEPIQRGLLPTACLKVLKTIVAPAVVSVVVQNQSEFSITKEIPQTIVAEPFEVLSKKQRKKKKKNLAAKEAGETSNEGQSIEVPKMTTRGAEAHVQKQLQSEVMESKPPDLGGK